LKFLSDKDLIENYNESFESNGIIKVENVKRLFDDFKVKSMQNLFK